MSPSLFSQTRGDRSWREPVNWPTAVVMVVLHAAALAAFFFFSWTALGVSLLLWWVAYGLGIGVGYHRLLTHRGFETPLWVERALALCGALALEGGPVFWVGTHRLHHRNSDKEGDPHSPRDGALWSHMGWILTGRALHADNQELLALCPDLRRDPFHLWLSRWHWLPSVALGALLFAAGGWSWLLWAGALRTVFGLHATWAVNSAGHLWGSRRYATRDTSRNNLWVALVSFGEGWHNNHHGDPRSAQHGRGWREIDINWLVLLAMQGIGLARKLVRPRPMIESLERAA